MRKNEPKRLHLVTNKAKRGKPAAAAATGTATTAESSKLGVIPRRSDLPAGLVQELRGHMLQFQLSDFASHLEVARAIWRQYPELVEAHTFPEHLRVAYVASHGEEPSDDCELAGVPYITAEVEAEARIDAMKWATERVAAGRGSR